MRKSEIKKDNVLIICIIVLLILLGIFVFMYIKANNEKNSARVVIFTSEDGKMFSQTTLQDGGLLEKPENPTKEGYIFKNWMHEGKEFDFSKPVQDNIVLIAVWEKEIIKYTIKFDSDGGNNISEQSIVEGEKITAPTNPTKEGYTFKGWLLNGEKYNFDQPVSKNLTLVASWEKTQTETKPTTSTTKPTTTKPSTTKPSTSTTTKVTYTISISKVDEYSPDRTLNVYANGSKISVKSVSYSDGTYLCSGSNMTVSASDISGETSFIVTLNDGSKVTAKVK